MPRPAADAPSTGSPPAEQQSAAGSGPAPAERLQLTLPLAAAPPRPQPEPGAERQALMAEMLPRLEREVERNWLYLEQQERDRRQQLLQEAAVRAVTAGVPGLLPPRPGC